MLALAAGPSTVAMMTFGVFVPHLNNSFNWGITATAFGATIMSLMIVVAAPIQGWLVDRLGTRKVILASIPLFGLSFASLSLLTGAIWQFYLAWVAIPLFAVGLWPGSYAKATSTWFDRRLGLAVAVATLGIGLGGAALPLLIGAILDAANWRTAYAALGFVAILISMPAVYFWVHENPAVAAAAKPPKTALWNWNEFRQPDLYKLLLGFVFLGFVSTSMLVHQVTVLTENGVSPANTLRLQALLGFSTIAGRLLSGWMLDRFHVRFMMPVYALLSAVALICLAQGAGGVIAGLAAVCVGLLLGAEIDVLGFVVKRYFGLSRYGSLYGLIFAAFQMGGASGAAALGVMRTSAGNYHAALMLLAALSVAAALIFFTLAPYHSSGSAPPKRIKAPILAR
ncbi:MFS transporter [Sphingobium sp. CECT 9361]|uniref:MFS transporter n=1 Tax=Sphingobium sp. CECT 9361 TaxID=2845384 RepID=UPI001E2DC9E0|nr:MFS transporter [Sphingobium sp. CECT 9361]